MSYEIAKSISVRKDKTTMVSRSNNVWPAIYETSTFPTNHAALLRELESGCIQPTDSANKYKWWWIMKEMAKCELQGDERVRHFVSLMESREPKGVYSVETASGFVQKYTPTRWWRTYALDQAKRYGYYQACYVAAKLSYHESKVVMPH